jgi:dephospho-CoA kinase
MTGPLPRRLLRVALTGGIATGKTHCLARLAAMGAPVIDADELARMAVEAGTPGLEAVVARFGAVITKPDGTLDREALGRIVFADAAARRDLEAIIHPAVYAGIERWFAELERWSGAKVGIADIPLLVETGHAADFDRVIVITCGRDLQLARLLQRGGLSPAEAQRRIDAQAPLADKLAKADFVIDTSWTHDETDRQLRAAWEALRNTDPDRGSSVQHEE